MHAVGGKKVYLLRLAFPPQIWSVFVLLYPALNAQNSNVLHDPALDPAARLSKCGDVTT